MNNGAIVAAGHSAAFAATAKAMLTTVSAGKNEQRFVLLSLALNNRSRFFWNELLLFAGRWCGEPVESLGLTNCFEGKYILWRNNERG